MTVPWYALALSARKNLPSSSCCACTALLAPDTRLGAVYTGEGDCAGLVTSLSVVVPRTDGLDMPSPCWWVGVLLDVGVLEGDSVPIRVFRAAERGVTLPVSEGASSFPGDLARTKASRRAPDAGVVGPEPARRGVNGLLAARKLELRDGVNGLPFGCLSGIVVAGVRLVVVCHCSSISRLDITMRRTYRHAVQGFAWSCGGVGS